METCRDRRALVICERYSFIGLAGQAPDQIGTDHEAETAENDHGQRADPHDARSHMHVIAMCDEDCIHVKYFRDGADEEGLHHERIDRLSDGCCCACVCS